MIKILIVDDEDFIRQGMHYAIPWEDYGMEVAGEAKNGQDALELALRLRPDIVLADIQMPLMNGLELAKRLNELLPDTRIIILTAYGSTDNMAAAIDGKVSAFLLKSADSQKILETVLHVKEEAELLRTKSNQVATLKDVCTENSHLIKATLLSRFLLNQISFSHFSKRSEKIGMTFDGSSYTLLLLRTNGEEESFVIRTLTHLFSDYNSFVFFMKDHLAMALLDTSAKAFEYANLEEQLPELLPVVFGNSIVALTNISCCTEFPLAYSQMIHAMDFCFWSPEKPCTFLSPKDQMEPSEIVPAYEQESQLIASILSQNEKSIRGSLEQYFAFMRQNRIPRDAFLESIKRLFILLRALSKEPLLTEQLIRTAEEAETPKEIMDILESLALPGVNAKPEASQITPALKYIDEHYMEDIYLDDAARAAYLSTGYLSRIFKLQTGYSFKEYLHRQRIFHAQEFIRTTGLKYYEIAELVGYKDYKYFSGYFSKIAGCSAKEYRHANR